MFLPLSTPILFSYRQWNFYLIWERGRQEGIFSDMIRNFFQTYYLWCEFYAQSSWAKVFEGQMYHDCTSLKKLLMIKIYNDFLQGCGCLITPHGTKGNAVLGSINSWVKHSVNILKYPVRYNMKVTVMTFYLF